MYKSIPGVVIGVDVSKETLDIAVSGGEAWRIPNRADAVEALLDGARFDLVAFEPTGGYERVLQAALVARRVAFERVHPNEVVAFRRSRGVKAKTDRIDARLIADFAAERLARRGPRPPIVADPALRELAARRRQLVEAIHAERCRLGLAESRAVRDSLERLIAAGRQSLAAIEKAIAAHIAADAETAALDALLRTVFGVGPVTAMTLIADLPELGHLSGKTIASLVGLAPNTRQSGQSWGKATTGFGRPGVRDVLFNAARAAIRWDNPFRAFYLRLVEVNGRPGKVALVAVMRKILVTLNAIARDGEPWRSASPPAVTAAVAEAA
jgi:transposase